MRGLLSQLEQVLFNLVVNAADAMPGGGHTEICTRVLPLASAALPTNVTAGPFLELSVNDAGSGLPDDVLPHLFEPFVSTKGEGKGTGLGRATSYAIVSR